MSALQVLQISCFPKQIFQLSLSACGNATSLCYLVVNPLCIICELYREQSVL